MYSGATTETFPVVVPANKGGEMYKWQKYEVSIVRSADTDVSAPNITSPSAAAELFHQYAKERDQESFWVMALSQKNQVLGIQQLYQGTVNGSSVRVGEAFRLAILMNAAAIVVVHNHPSGAVAESDPDVHMTMSLVEAGSVLDIEVLDHLIVTDTEYLSLRAKFADPEDGGVDPWSVSEEFDHAREIAQEAVAAL
jgi:DNA repair protein RadC